MAAVIRAVFGYCLLVFIVRVVGRRPGKQMTPFEFVLIFFIGGLALTAMVGEEVSFTNALCQIITVALVHYCMVWMRSKSSRIARLFDGTPLVLLEKGQWRSTTMKKMRVYDDDVMAAARAKKFMRLGEIEYAVLERNGEISILAAPDSSEEG
ncbi:MAG TPA: YetF domain-containing protein [Acidobacteriaceae bacterium]|nr:YetF domain-containing protein [Acidobacteriaceae bacterium]